MLIVKYNVGLKIILQQVISEPVFYGDLNGKHLFPDQFKRIIKRYKRVRYTCTMDSIRPSAWLVINTIMVYIHGASSSVAR